MPYETTLKCDRQRRHDIIQLGIVRTVKAERTIPPASGDDGSASGHGPRLPLKEPYGPRLLGTDKVVRRHDRVAEVDPAAGLLDSQYDNRHEFITVHDILILDLF